LPWPGNTNKPTRSITRAIPNEKDYASCLNYTINSFTIDQEALYAAMQEHGDNEITLTATLQFPERSTTADTATWTKTIVVTLAD